MEDAGSGRSMPVASRSVMALLDACGALELGVGVERAGVDVGASGLLLGGEVEEDGDGPACLPRVGKL